MPEVRRNISKALEDMDSLRLLVLTDGQESAEIRSLLRRIFYQLEDLQRHPFISTTRHQKITSLLASLLDAEHGALIKGSAEEGLNEEDTESLNEYIANRKNIMQEAQQDMPSVYKLIIRCSDLLGKDPASENDIAVKCKLLETQLREHLQDDASLRQELNHLTSAFENSLNFLTDILEATGSDAPELQQVKNILQQDLPEDPKKAHELLQNARKNLLQAGEKISSATTALKDNMETQVTQIKALSSRLEDAESQARSDPLTGLANRRKLAEFLSTVKDTTASFIMLDIDHFKSINDTYGHDAGDEILTVLASILTESVRETDMVARLGGEEFCIVLVGINAEPAFHIAEKVRQSIEVHPFKTRQGKVDVNISLGVAEHRDKEAHAAWIKRADQALYQSKEGGRNRVTLVQ